VILDHAWIEPAIEDIGAVAKAAGITPGELAVSLDTGLPFSHPALPLLSPEVIRRYLPPQIMEARRVETERKQVEAKQTAFDLLSEARASLDHWAALPKADQLQTALEQKFNLIRQIHGAKTATQQETR